jgi:hypothetical protein
LPKAVLASAIHELPPMPRVKLSEQAIARLYAGQRYSNLLVPDEPLWTAPLPESARAV